MDVLALCFVLSPRPHCWCALALRPGGGFFMPERTAKGNTSASVWLGQRNGNVNLSCCDLWMCLTAVCGVMTSVTHRRQHASTCTLLNRLMSGCAQRPITQTVRLASGFQAERHCIRGYHSKRCAQAAATRNKSCSEHDAPTSVRYKAKGPQANCA